MVTERVKNKILNLVVDIFTKTHEPVGSKALQDAIQSVARPFETTWLPIESKAY